MRIFKFRNLALACFGFLIALYLCNEVNKAVRIIGFCVSALFVVLTLVLFLSTKKKLFKNAFFRYTPLCVFIILAIIISFTVFDKAKEKSAYCDGNEHVITAKVDTVLKSTDYSGLYVIDISEIDGVSESFSVALHDETGKLLANDIICAKVVFNTELARDLGNGINFGAMATEYISAEAGENDFDDYFKQANSFLDSLFKDSLNEETHSLMSAMFLGNRNGLDESVNRDFARVGLVHILSLSGMHVSIFMAVVCFIISKLGISKTLKVILTTAAIFGFIAITGFHETTLRAGLMQFFFFASFYIWERPDNISSLFLSVFIICLFDPYAVFSFSLLLSFLAMLGCLCSGYVMRKSRIFLKCRTRVGKFCLITILSSAFVTAMTIPLVALKFKQISLFTVFSNLIIAPFLNILIYIAPLMLLVARVPYISDALAFVCEGITYLCTSACALLSSVDFSVITLSTSWQLIGAFVIFIGAWLFMILSKKRIRVAVFTVIIGFLILAASTVCLFVTRLSNSYVSARSTVAGDAVFIENGGGLTVIEASGYTLSSMAAYNGQTELGYTEIEAFIACDYNHRLPTYIDVLTDKTIVRCVYLQKPRTEKEHVLNHEIEGILNSKGILLEYIKQSFEVQGAKLDFCLNDYNASSTKRAVSFSALIDNVRVTYLGASSYELVDYFPTDYASSSDYLIFGSYGPSYKIKYDYDTSCLDYCLFLGKSKDFASLDLQSRCYEKEIDAYTKIRIPNT